MLAIVNGHVRTMAGPVIKGGRVLIEGSKILAVGGQEIAVPAEAQVIDAAGKEVMPGLIDAHCHLGIMEEIYQIEGDDTNEYSDPVTPHLRAIDAVNPMDAGFRDAVRAGVTAVFTGPGSANVVGGLGLVMHTFGRVVDHMVLKNPAGLKVAFGENPKRVHGEQKKMPMTRMANAALLRENLVAAQNYLAKFGEAAEPGKRPERNLKLEALGLALQGIIPLRAHAHRADDMMTAIRIAEEFGVKLVLEHCTEGHLIADELGEKGVPVVVGPSLTSRAKVELKERSFKTAGVLANQGLTVALMTDHPVIPIEYLPVCAALAVKDGMRAEEALKAITINPAKILGVEGQIGSIEKGKSADIIVVNGSILDLYARVELVIVSGKVIYNN
ncbi:amidohydrolase [Zhaonella formicivorans]|uniref:amidohydrolase n=1 Tax=Zhaonella formicivorans TaxID=2528593 RepID=UPI0010E23AFE|nr:amidohydrolase [Zhaonella formicivorans]